MLKTDFYMTRSDGVNLYRTYSDINHYIEQIDTNIRYIEAVDIENSVHTYQETDIPIEEENIEG